MDTPMEQESKQLTIEKLYQKIEYLEIVIGFILKETGLMGKLK